MVRRLVAGFALIWLAEIGPASAQALCPQGWTANGTQTCVLQRTADCPEGFELKSAGTTGFTCVAPKPIRMQPDCLPGDRTTDNGRYCLGSGGRYSRTCRPGFNLTDTLTGQDCRSRANTDPTCPPDSAFVAMSGECRGVRTAIGG
jgi:hypothetical protein